MPEFDVTVTIECADKAEAERVIAERIDYDEDYGFDYTISWSNARKAGTKEDECFTCGRNDVIGVSKDGELFCYRHDPSKSGVKT